MTNYIIERLGHQGDGIAEGPVYAVGTLPGEVVTGVLSGTRLTDVRIETPSDQRVRPPCSHAKACGGCQLQHASDAFVAAWKAEVVKAALTHQGLECDVLGPVTSLAQSRRRATFSIKRTKKGALVGFHAKASDVIVEIPNCQLLHPDLVAARPMLEKLGVLAATRKAELSVLATVTKSGLDLDVHNGKPIDTELNQSLAALANQHKIARISWNGEVVLTLSAPIQFFDSIAVTPPPGAFLQATPHGETALRKAVQQIVDDAKNVVDLFAGCGTFGLPLTKSAAVHAIEGSSAMMKAMDHAWRQAGGLHSLTVQTRDLFRNPLLPEELNRFDAAVIDPPRAGAEAQIEQLAQSSIPRIAYVSCSPVTFARDCATQAKAGYRLSRVLVVDQFRWSTHIEVVGALVKV